jgi:hypothetical protein
MIDPSIPLQVRTPSLAQVYLQAQQLKSMQQEQQLRTLSLAQATQGYQDQQSLRGAYTPGATPEQAIATLEQTNPYVAQQEKARVAKQKTDAAEATAKLTDQELKNHQAMSQRFSSLLSTATPENYGAVLQTALNEKVITPEEIQQHGLASYNPDAIKQTMNASVSYADQLKNEQRDRELKQQKAHNDALEAAREKELKETQNYHAQEITNQRSNIGLRTAEFNQRQQAQNFDQDASIENQAQQIASGEVKPLSQSRANPRSAAIMKRAYEINPKLSDSLYAVTQDLRSSKPNSMGANVGRLGTAILHADQALQDSKNIGFSESLLTGFPTAGTAQYRQSADFLKGELAQFVQGKAITEGESKRLGADLYSSRQSVRDAALNRMISLSGGKLKSQMEQFKNATGGNDFPTDRVFNDPEISGALRKHGVLEGGAPQGGGSFDWNAHPVVK